MITFTPSPHDSDTCVARFSQRQWRPTDLSWSRLYYIKGRNDWTECAITMEFWLTLPPEEQGNYEKRMGTFPPKERDDDFAHDLAHIGGPLVFQLTQLLKLVGVEVKVPWKEPKSWNPKEEGPPA